MAKYIYNGGAVHAVEEDEASAFLKAHEASQDALGNPITPWREATDEEVAAEEARQDAWRKSLNVESDKNLDYVKAVATAGRSAKA